MTPRLEPGRLYDPAEVAAIYAAPPAPDRLLLPSEVARMFRVDPKTVTRWARAGKISAVRTLGGHRRYRESEIRALLAGETERQP